MPKKPAEIERLVIRKGFKIEKGKGKGGHRRYKHPDGQTTEIPFHSKEIPRPTERAILKDIGLN